MEFANTFFLLIKLFDLLNKKLNRIARFGRSNVRITEVVNTV